jgi:membrane protein CcdC involved in cytochrome C biogenesis
MLPPKELSVLASVAGAAGVLAWRVREGRTAVTARKILIPPMGMATGFSMFLVPACRIPWQWAACAFVIGATLLAYPLLRTSRLIHDGKAIMMQRSSAFFVVVIALAVIRILAHTYFDRFLSLEQTGALFFVLAFGMIVRWRTRMYLEYRQIACETA